MLSIWILPPSLHNMIQASSNESLQSVMGRYDLQTDSNTDNLRNDWELLSPLREHPSIHPFTKALVAECHWGPPEGRCGKREPNTSLETLRHNRETEAEAAVEADVVMTWMTYDKSGPVSILSEKLPSDRLGPAKHDLQRSLWVEDSLIKMESHQPL